MEKKLNLNILKKTIIIINFLFVATAFCNAQNYNLHKTISEKTNDFELDKFGNIYTISKDNSVTKYNSKGEKLYIFSEVIGYDLTLDVSNPLKPIGFSKEWNNVYILDHKLSLLETIEFSNKELYYITNVATANGSNYLVYDKSENKLKKLDKALNVIHSSQSFLNLFNKENKIIRILEYENNVYILDKEGIKVFDSFLTFKKTISLLDLDDFQIFGDEIIYYKYNKLNSYNTKTLQHKEMQIPLKENIIQVKLIKYGLVVLTKDGLYLYFTI